MWVCAFLLAIALTPLSPLDLDRKHSVCVLCFGIFQYVTRACSDTDVLFPDEV